MIYPIVSPSSLHRFSGMGKTTSGSNSPARLLGDAFICLAQPSWDLSLWMVQHVGSTNGFPMGNPMSNGIPTRCHLRGTPGLSHVWGLELRIQWKMNVETLNHRNWGISNLSDKLMWTFCKEKSTHLQTIPLWQMRICWLNLAYVLFWWYYVLFSLYICMYLLGIGVRWGPAYTGGMRQEEESETERRNWITDEVKSRDPHLTGRKKLDVRKIVSKTGTVADKMVNSTKLYIQRMCPL